VGQYICSCIHTSTDLLPAGSGCHGMASVAPSSQTLVVKHPCSREKTLSAISTLAALL
jgi:hypothetical protein